MNDQPGADEGRQPTEEELLAAYEEQVKQLRIEDVLVQTIVSLLNLGGRKAGLAPGTEDERDLGQVRLAVEGARSLMPLVEPVLGPDAGQVRQALSQLQMAYARLSGGGPGGQEPPSGEGADAPKQPESPQQDPGSGAGPAQQSGRLWVPGQ